MAASLITPELLRRLEQFQLLAQRRAKSAAKGERRSKARGQSVEFADYRNYVAGDDFRYLDWNLFGRLDRLFLKLYEEERELPVTIVLSDFLEPEGYEPGLTALLGRGFQVSAVQILAPEEVNPDTYGDLRLVDSETGAVQEVTFGKFRLNSYRQTVQNYIQRLRE